MINKIKEKLIYIYLVVYGFVNLFFLTKFPFMHSDESWLSGLSSTMMKQGLASTESFFDLFPRYPHAIKIIFHIIQMGFVAIFGNHLFTFRLISLIFGIISIYLIYLIGNTLFKNKWLSIGLAILVSVDIQFIYASHFARQEIIILTGLLFSFYLLIKHVDHFTLKYNLMIAATIGLLIGIHPNSFLVALVIGLLYLYYIFVAKKLAIKHLVGLIAGVNLFAVIFVFISYIFDSHFIANYLKYGADLGVTNTLAVKGSSIFTFYQKLFLQISGTYYTPNIQIQFALFAILFIITVIVCFKNKKYLLFILPVVAINIGYILIGRYSQPSIIFIFPFLYMMVFQFINDYGEHLKKYIVIVLIISVLVSSVISIVPYLNNDYKEYINKIDDAIPSSANVLVNLNGAYALTTNQIYDYRNLNYLEDYNLTFEKYIINNDIDYIVYLEEMDYIYNNRPTWNIVYGNIYPYYEDMKTYFNDNCELLDTFYSPYAMRIVRYSNEKEWFVKIYKVKR